MCHEMVTFYSSTSVIKSGNLTSLYWATIVLWNRPKPFHFAIVDEVDSVLIDEGRNPLLISGEVIWMFMSKKEIIWSFRRLFVVVFSTDTNLDYFFLMISFFLFIFSTWIYLIQASKDAARYPVASRVAELLIRGLVSCIFPPFPFLHLKYCFPFKKKNRISNILNPI